MITNYYTGNGLTPGEKQPVEASGGSTNVLEPYTDNTHYSNCICEPCKKSRGNLTGKDAIYNQYHSTPPIYPDKQ